MNILPAIKPPRILDIRTNAADNWKTYKQVWQNYAIIEDSKFLTKIFEMFDLHTISEVNETYERYIFNCRNQKPDESIDAYVAAHFCDCLKVTLC